MTGVVEHALDEYRDHVRQWTAQHLSLRSQDTGRHALGDLADDDVEAAKRIQHKIFNAGFIGITLPTEYGGAGLTAAHERIWYEESSKYAVPIPRGVATLVTLGIILPTVLAHGSEDQKRDWIPRMLSGDDAWVQLLSEPSAGSDLAGLRTRATRDGDSWVLNGAKVWSSGADRADFGICLARTDWDVPKHQGLTWFKVPLDDDRITVRPIREINGSAAFCEEFLDDIVVGADMVIGAVNGGWAVANALLAYERAGGSGGAHGIRGGAEGALGAARVDRLAPDLVALVEEGNLTHDRAARQLIARAHINDYMQHQLAERVMETMRTGKANAAAASLLKLGIGVVNPVRAQIAMELAGRRGIAWEADAPGAGAALDYLNGRVMSIGGGSDQIQRNIISERLLGLPREPSFDTDKPFRDVLLDAKNWGQA